MVWLERCEKSDYFVGYVAYGAFTAHGSKDCIRSHSIREPTSPTAFLLWKKEAQSLNSTQHRKYYVEEYAWHTLRTANSTAVKRSIIHSKEQRAQYGVTVN